MIKSNKDSQRPDSEFIKDFKNGDIKGYNEIVKKYQEQVYWVIRKMVLNHDDADDITQEVFIKVYSALRDFREESNLFTWLYRIAVNYSINHLNKIKNKGNMSVELIKAQIESEDKKPDELIDDKERRDLLINAIETLPVQQRTVFNMRYYDELSYDEISKILNKSVGGVKANYFHAVKKIGEYLKGRIQY